MSSLIDFVRASVSPVEYYDRVFDGIKWPSGAGEPRLKCSFHTQDNGEQEKTPSLHLNPATGAWYCHSAKCKEGGKSIISFHARAEGTSHLEAARDLFHQHIHPVIDDKLVRRWTRKLIDTPSAIRYIKSRFVHPQVIKTFELGWDGNRVVMPIRNEFGICVNAKLYDPLAKSRGVPKMVNYSRKEEARQYGKPVMIWPLTVFELAQQLGYVVICEGEWDTLVLLSMGIPAVTSSGGSKSWPAQYNEMFRGLDVVIAYDNDADGTTHDKRPLRELRNIAKAIKRIRIPSRYGKDVEDWVRNKPLMRKRAIWEREIKRAKTLIENPDSVVQKGTIFDLPLDEASRAAHYSQRIRVSALIAGKAAEPYILPRRYRVSCSKTCDGCPLSEWEGEFKDKEVDPRDHRVLSLIDIGRKQMDGILLGMAGMHPTPGCKAKVEVVEMFNLEQLQLIPTLDTSTGQYVIRSAYYSGHGLYANRGYKFEGTTLPHPRDGRSTHLFDVATPANDDLGSFEVSPDLIKDLKAFRQPKMPLLAWLMNMAEWQSRNITHIRERPDMHILTDLVFHSVRSFSFNGEFVHRGMLDAIIFGDTRCGKGYVVEGLCRYYGLGEIASGENLTFAGLVGGCQQAGRQWLVTWGIIPLNNGRFVCIDEASALSTESIGHMSRVRSEGVAEITKIVKEKTPANTRLLWLSNSRSGLPIRAYNTGVEALKELIGANEDVARFDIALTVATQEVDSRIINVPWSPDDVRDSGKFPPELCKSLVLWAWSRSPEQVKFTDGATALIIQEAVKLGNEFSPIIPLIQAENVRIKVAKIAASVATRVFSSDESGEEVIIRKRHVKVAVALLRLFYSKPSMGYSSFSRTSVASSTVGEPKTIEEKLDVLGSDKESGVAGLLQMHRITPDGLADFVGDPQTARVIIGDLVRLGCLSRVEKGSWYMKSPAFTAWLRERNDR